VVDRDVAIALTMKLGLHATQPQASLWIRFHSSCVRLDKVTNAIYFSNFKKIIYSNSLFIFSLYAPTSGSRSVPNKRKNYGLFKGGIFEDT